MTFDELLVSRKEADLFRKQAYSDKKEAVNNALVSIINQLFGKDGDNKNG